jgi:hypothetical protein
MNDYISNCIDSINNIDNEVMYAECSVLGALNNWDSKTADMMKYTENDESTYEYLQEATGAGTGTRKTTPGFMGSVIRMIKRFIRKIIDVIADLMVRIGSSGDKFEYIAVPYKPDELIQDIKTVEKTDKDLLELLREEVTPDRYESIKPHLKEFENRLTNLYFYKTTNKSTPNAAWGIKRDQWLIIRDELRSLDRSMRDTEKFIDNVVSKIEFWGGVADKMAPDNSTAKDREATIEIYKMAQNIYAKSAEFTAKVFTSFRYGKARAVVKKSDKEESKQ